VVNNRNRVVDADGRGPADHVAAEITEAGGDAAGRLGRIILVASTGGLHGDVGLSAYAASKGGLLAFGRSLAAEGVPTNLLEDPW
jgi:NAD(P)-dependent dehydrogenase (short-subunit alcohol dehydrogenase family)